MTFAAGSFHGLGYLEETTFGTTPAGNYNAVRHNGATLGVTKDGFQSAELRDDRMISDFRHGAIRVGGDIPFEFSYGEFDDLLEGALFGDWNANVLNAGTTVHSYTFRTRHADVLVDAFFPGCMINTFNLSCPANAMLTGSFGVIGKNGTYSGSLHTVTITVTSGCTSAGNLTVTVAGVANQVAVDTDDDTTAEVATAIQTTLDALSDYTATVDGSIVTLIYPAVLGAYAVTFSAGTTGTAATVGTPAVTAPVASETNSPFDSFSGSITEGGSAIAVITSIDFSLSNNLAPTFVVGAETTPYIVPGRSNLTGTVSAYFQNVTLMNKFLNETESSIVLTTGATSLYYDIELPRIKYTGGNLPVNNEGALVISMPFQALYDSGEGTSLIITRHPA